jgi:hypothetical protein
MRIFDWVILGVYCAAILGLATYFQNHASGGIIDFLFRQDWLALYLRKPSSCVRAKRRSSLMMYCVRYSASFVLDRITNFEVRRLGSSLAQCSGMSCLPVKRATAGTLSTPEKMETVAGS